MKKTDLRIFDINTIVEIQAEAAEYAFIKTKLSEEIDKLVGVFPIPKEDLTTIDKIIDESILNLKMEELQKYTIIDKTKEEYEEILKDSKRFNELSMMVEEEEWLGYMDAISEEDLDYEEAEDEDDFEILTQNEEDAKVKATMTFNALTEGTIFEGDLDASN
jgi:hypothetical protein